MVAAALGSPPCGGRLSVLALSSRFDGLGNLSNLEMLYLHFQYSLCRVVLMVTSPPPHPFCSVAFQYSLCRVVLMVLLRLGLRHRGGVLSVLALSSRFDGLVWRLRARLWANPFSTRSVESF